MTTMTTLPYVIGFDVGGTRIKSGAVTVNGDLFHAAISPSGYKQPCDALLHYIEERVAHLRRVMDSDPQYLVLGFPGAVDPERGVVLLPGKLQVEGFDFVPTLRRSTGLPVVAENDGRLSILAEMRYGKARGRDWAVSITLGTGVGSGVLLDGKVLRDPHLQFGTQASHIVLEAGSPKLCMTRARGTANVLCSATALASAVKEALARGMPSALNDAYFRDPHSIDFESVLRAVEQDDTLCLDALAQWRQRLGWFLVSVVHMYAPEIIILSGGAAAGAPCYVDHLRKMVAENTYRYGDPVAVEVSDLSTYSGVFGAAALAWQLLESPSAKVHPSLL